MKIAVATPDTLTARMAGPAIRAWQIANALAAEHDVQLVTTTIADLPDSPFPVRAVDDAGLAEVERWCDVLCGSGRRMRCSHLRGPLRGVVLRLRTPHQA